MTKETAEPPPRRGSATAATPTPHHLLWGPNHRPVPAGSTGAEQSAVSLLGSRHSTAPPESPSETFSSLPLARHVPTLASGMLIDHSHQFLPWKAHLRPSDPFPSPATSPTLASGMLLAHSRQVCLRAFALAVPLAWNGFPGDRMPRSLTELSSLLSCPSIKRPCLE